MIDDVGVVWLELVVVIDYVVGVFEVDVVLVYEEGLYWGYVRSFVLMFG